LPEPGERQLVGEGWSLRAERVEMPNGNDCVLSSASGVASSYSL
jgi:hypothetical protein